MLGATQWKTVEIEVFEIETWRVSILRIKVTSANNSYLNWTRLTGRLSTLRLFDLLVFHDVIGYGRMPKQLNKSNKWIKQMRHSSLTIAPLTIPPTCLWLDLWLARHPNLTNLTHCQLPRPNIPLLHSQFVRWSIFTENEKVKPFFAHNHGQLWFVELWTMALVAHTVQGAQATASYCIYACTLSVCALTVQQCPLPRFVMLPTLTIPNNPYGNPYGQ